MSKQLKDMDNWGEVAGELIGSGAKSILVLGGATVVCVGVAVFFVARSFYAAPAPIVAVPVQTAIHPAPVYSPVVADPKIVIRPVLGECFRTPMGDDGKVIEQDNDMLTMTFRGGVKATYRYDQVTSAACGPSVR